MTLPTSGALTLSNVLTELKIANSSRAAPVSLGDADVLALAGKSAPPISLSDLYGKSAYVPMVITATNDAASAISNKDGTVTCHPSVAVTNGKGTKSFLWSFTSNPNGCMLSDATLQSCSVSSSYLFGEFGSSHAVLQCVITDDVTSVTKSSISADLSWSS